MREVAYLSLIFTEIVNVWLFYKQSVCNICVTIKVWFFRSAISVKAMFKVTLIVHNLTLSNLTYILQFLLPTTYYLQPTTYNLQPTTYNLGTTCHLQLATHHLQPTTYHLPLTTIPTTYNHTYSNLPPTTYVSKEIRCLDHWDGLILPTEAQNLKITINPFSETPWMACSWSWGSMDKVGGDITLESWLFEFWPCSRLGHYPAYCKWVILNRAKIWTANFPSAISASILPIKW